MADFDPDAYLAAKTEAPAAGGFDPDAYLESKEQPEAPPVDVKALARARMGLPPGPRDLTSEEAGTSAGPITSLNQLRPSGAGGRGL